MKNGKDSTHKKRAFKKKTQENQSIKKEPVVGIYFRRGKKEQVSRLLPMDTPHPEDNGDAAGGFAEQSACPRLHHIKT